MKTKFKKNIVAIVCIIVVIDASAGYLLFKSRLFSHLSVWNVLEFDKQGDFYWPPENAPAYFHFEPNSDKISGFKEDILTLVKNEADEFKTILAIAKYTLEFKTQDSRPKTLALKWDSPAGMLRQVQQGALPNCFHRAILFSTYLSSLGIKSRLWTLENDNFNAAAHSINEVYIKDLKKWVFIDVMFGFYVTEDGIPLSLLEFRERLLSGNFNKILFVSLRAFCAKPRLGGALSPVAPRNDTVVPLPFTNQLPIYRRLIKCVFLRADNDFTNRYNHRYGILCFTKHYIDRLPDNIRRGLDYLLGRQKFIHYVDRFSKSLRPEIVLAKLFFYFLVFSSTAIVIFAVDIWLSWLKCLNMPDKNLSHKHTRQR